MKNIIILALTILTASATFAQQPDAEYRLIRQSYTLNADHSLDIRYHKELILHTNRAMTAYATNGETFILYNPQYETLTINQCRFIRPDGTVVETPSNAFVQQLPEQCTDCATFNHIREMAIIHTGLELEGTIVLDYTIHTSTPLNEHLFLVENYPVNHYELTVSAPQSIPYFVQPENLERIQYNTNFSHGIFSLTANNLPKRMSDAFLPTNEELYPHIYLSTIKSQDFDGLIPNAGQCPDFRPMLEQFSQSDPLSKALAIRDWVLDNITLSDLPSRILFTCPNQLNVNQAYRTNCADPVSQVRMLSLMLKQAGISNDIESGSVRLQEYMNQKYIYFDPKQAYIHLDINGQKTILDPFSKKAYSPQDSPKPIRINSTIAYQPEVLTNCHSIIRLPQADGSFNIPFQAISPYRSTPFRCGTADEDYTYTIQLPKGANLVDKKTHKQYSKDGLGLVEVSISQKGQTVTIQRHLKIEQSTISVSDLFHIYQILSIWDSTKQIAINCK